MILTSLRIAMLAVVGVPLVDCSPINNGRKHKHAPLFNGTDATLPKNLKDNTVVDKIEDVNEEMTNKEKKEVQKEARGQLFESDIMLTRQDKEYVDLSKTEGKGEIHIKPTQISKRKAVRSRKMLWPSRNIPLEVSSVFAEKSGEILAALKEIQDNSCIRFHEKDKHDKHWIRIVKKVGCWSPVGRQYQTEGFQELSVGEGCNYKQIIVHELMHALGFWHEQSRTDRDEYIDVLWENIKPEQLHNFNEYDSESMDLVGSVYDFESILHYGNKAFSKNDKPTMLSIKDPDLQFGSRTKLSKSDILQLNRLYDCTTTNGGWSSWTGYGPCNKQCTKKRERFCTNRDRSKCPGVDSEGIEEEVTSCPREECYAPIPGHWGRWSSWSRCSVTCGKGYIQRSRGCDDPKPMYDGDLCKGPLVEVSQCQAKHYCYADELNVKTKRFRMLHRQRSTSAINQAASKHINDKDK